MRIGMYAVFLASLCAGAGDRPPAPASSAKRVAPAGGRIRLAQARTTERSGGHGSTKRRKAVAEAVATDTMDIPLGAEEALARLKLLRIQMAIDREEIEALNLRLQKLELQQQVQALLGAEEERPRRHQEGVRKPRSRPSIADQVLVKAVQTKPVKEALVMFRGKLYRLREGDEIEPGLAVGSISEKGLNFVLSGGRARRVSAP